MVVGDKYFSDDIDIDVCEWLSFGVDLVSAVYDFEFADAEYDASCEFVEFSEEGVDLSDFIVVFDVVFEWEFEFVEFVLLL